MFWHTFRAIVWDILSQMKSPTRQINASTKNFPFTHFFAASVLHRDPAYSILELFSVLNPIWSLVYPMSLKDRSIFYLDKKCCSLICSRILEHELQGGVIQHFFSIFENLHISADLFYFQKLNSKKSAISAARSSKFSFSKNLKEIFKFIFKNLQRPSSCVKEQSTKLKF